MNGMDDCLVAADALRDELVEDLRDLVAIPSTGGSSAELQVQHWVADRLDAMGLPVRRWRTSIEELAAEPGFPGTEVPRDEVVGVLAQVPGRMPDPTLLLGHTDVVPPADWPDAFRPGTAGDLVVGRGAADMKAGVAATIHVARVLTRTRVTPTRTLWLAPVSAEEDGGAGAFDLVRRLDRLPAECLIAEPTGGDIVVANAGALGFRITVVGRSAHAAERWEGVDALAAAAAVHAGLADLERHLAAGADPLLSVWPIPHPTVIGTIAGGEWASTVMPRLTMTGRYGIPLGADVAAMRRLFEDTVAEAVAATDSEAHAEVAWEGGQFAPGRQDPEHPAVRRLVRSHRAVFGTVPRILGTTYGSDLRLLLAAGVPTLVYGPGDMAQAHTTGESVAIRDVLASVHVILRWVLDAD